MRVPRLWVAVVSIVVTPFLFIADRRAGAQPAHGRLMPIAAAKGKVGLVRVTLAERSPLSADLKVLAERTGLLPAKAGAAEPDLTDYDLSKVEFVVRVPATAADDGKYGVMVGQCYREFDWPPAAWGDVLDKYHLIWIAANGSGDDTAVARRIGLLLDAAHNAAAVWPVDHDRVYLSMNAFKDGVCGTAYYYPDVFAGQVQTIGTPWYAKLDGFEDPPLTWNTDTFAEPRPKDLERAKARSRFYLAKRDDFPNNKIVYEMVMKHGYNDGGYKYAEGVILPEARIDHYGEYPADWFENGVKFLDAPLAEVRAKDAADPAAH